MTLIPPDSQNPDLSQGDSIGSYAIRNVVYLENLSAHLYDIEHVPAGARHVHISSKDPENIFSVGFKTVPKDSTGVAHILEHTVLCGSRKFPVRDPFFSMLKRSLNTFMNAFTASDWTMYPFATQNRKDYYNLMDVYLDATFFPAINELSFKQEGHRLEIRDGEEGNGYFSLERKGVVYNEMKGAMSSPNQVLFRSLMNALYPDTTYRHNSGGDPADIPLLTHEALVAFHKRHYHPSNAFFYTYGNLPLSEHLAFIEAKVLSHFDKIDPGTDVPGQPRWDRERRATYAYPLSRSENPENKNQVCMAWLTADILNTFDVLSLSLLERILLGNAASPLRKALIESELGSALSDGTGFDRDNRDTLFACGLKDVADSDIDRVRELIFDTLDRLFAEGIDREMIDSAIHQMEFHRKEVTNSPYPYGIKMLLVFSGSWFHGADPAHILQFDKDIEKIREKVAAGPYFENLIKKYFLDNSHRVFFTLTPDPDMEENENRRQAAELEKIKEALTPADIEKIREDQAELEKLQNGEEDLATLPTLGIEDIPPEITRVKEREKALTVPLAAYALPTSGILYASAVFRMKDIEERHIPLAPVFSMVFSKAGTRKHDYMQMARLMDASTGGIGMASHARTGFTEKDCIPFVSLRGKCLNRNADAMFNLMEELIVDFGPSDLERIKVLLRQYRAGLEAGVVQSGHRLAISLASRNFSTARGIEERWHGIHQLLAVKKITENLDDDALASICRELEALGRRLLVRSAMQTALVGEADAIAAWEGRAAALGGSLDESAPGIGTGMAVGNSNELPHEGWHTSTAVSFVASCFQTVRLTHEDSPVIFVISKLLRSLYLHREIREKGGAYGGFAVYSLEDGVFGLSSYRDPHILNTLKVYDGVEGFLKSGRYDDEDIKEAILQCCSEIDRPDSPGEAGQKAFFRKIIGLTDEMRLAFKAGILAVTRDRVAEVGEKYFNARQNKRAVVVISGLSQLEEAGKQMEKSFQINKI